MGGFQKLASERQSCFKVSIPRELGDAYLLMNRPQVAVELSSKRSIVSLVSSSRGWIVALLVLQFSKDWSRDNLLA